MDNLSELGLVNAVKSAAMSGRPFLGICLGMQIKGIKERLDSTQEAK